MDKDKKPAIKAIELPDGWVKVKGGYALDLAGTGCMFVTGPMGTPVYLHDFNVVDGKLCQ